MEIINYNICFIIVGIYIDKIIGDDTFWKNKMELPLSKFYINHKLP